MIAPNIAMLLELIIQGTISVQKYAQLVRAARAEDRDVTDAEIGVLAAEDDVVARAEEATIAAARLREAAGPSVG